MLTKKNKFSVIGAVPLLFFGTLLSCGSPNSNADAMDSLADTIIADTIVEVRIPVPGDEDYKFENYEAMREYLDTCADASKYALGIMPVIAEDAPEYAEKLIGNQHERFIVVDKASMNVLLYDKYGRLEKEYGMACAKNYGTKHKKADSRTPEGFFTVEGRYNSTEWLFTDDNGVQSKKKGQFGPRFIRLKIPNTTQIGIHGTCAPWSIGHRSSHGCIRILNENILELVDLVEPGVPVIVLPGKRDRQVNREEGYDIPYFPTSSKYAMNASERTERPLTREEIEEKERMEKEANREVASSDSLGYINSLPPVNSDGGPYEQPDTLMF